MELYYVDKKNIFSTYVRITGTEAHHIMRVMRYKPGDMLFVADGDGNEYQTMIKQIDRKFIEAEIINQSRNARESTIKITLAQSIIKGNRMDFVIEKASGLGVYEIIPTITERTIASVSDKKSQRYQKLMLAAMKSSTQTRLPYLAKPIQFKKLLETVDDYNVTLLAWEDEKTNRLSNVISKNILNKILLIVGPEGGFTDNEIKIAKISGAKYFSLGLRRLRAETAAIAALSLLLYELQEM